MSAPKAAGGRNVEAGRRALVAGFGNELRGDDGFGVAVIHRLEAGPAIPGVRLLEVGTGGMRLAQELLTPYDRLVVVDALRSGRAPGTVTVLEVRDVEATTAVDLHLAVPSRALAVAKALGALPPRVYFIGCEPDRVDDLGAPLSPAVARAVADAVRHVRQLVTMDGDPSKPGAERSHA